MMSKSSARRYFPCILARGLIRLIGEGGDLMNKKGKKKITLPSTPLTETMAGAERYTMDIKNHVSHPSDEAVEEMRKWCEENIK